MRRSPHAHAQFTYRTVAQSGVAGFTDFDIALIANNGLTSMKATQGSEGVWAENGVPGNLLTLAKVGVDSNFGCQSEPTEAITRPSMNSAGLVTLAAMEDGLIFSAGACSNECASSTAVQTWSGILRWNPGSPAPSVAMQVSDSVQHGGVTIPFYPAGSPGFFDGFVPRIGNSGSVTVYDKFCLNVPGAPRAPRSLAR